MKITGSQEIIFMWLNEHSTPTCIEYCIYKKELHVHVLPVVKLYVCTCTCTVPTCLYLCDGYFSKPGWLFLSPLWLCFMTFLSHCGCLFVVFVC